MKVFRLVLLLLIGCYQRPSFGQNNLPSVPTYLVNDDLLEQVLPNQEWLIEEGEQSLSIQEIRSGIIKDGTIIEGGDQFSVRRDRAYWYKMVLISPVGNEHEKLNINQTGSYGASISAPNTVNAYFFFDGKMVDDGYSGIGVGNAQRDVKHVFYPTLIDFNLPSNQPLEIWIKVVSDQDFKGQFATTLVSHRVDITSLNRFGTVNQIVLGSLIFMLLVGLFLWYWFRERVYVWFLIFVLVNLWTIIIYMTGNQFIDSLFPENPILINLILGYNDLLSL
ncbi:MAG: hypothetical protein IPL46_22305 [Saprospiraceae bacterium]|nr:hypothetical protein [Saprospiraceae bacterium]